MPLKEILEKRRHKKRMKEDPMGFLLEEITKVDNKLEEVAETAQDVKKKQEDEEFELDLNLDDFPSIKGEKGDTGSPGAKGDTGQSGASGEVGSDGIDGKDGKNGEDGLDGKQGEQGDSGKDGQDGKDGEDVDMEELEKRLRDMELRIREAKSKGVSLGGGGGSKQVSVNTITSSTTLNSTQYVILCNSTTDFTVTLPSASVNNRRVYHIKNINTNAVTVDGSGAETIDDGLLAVIMNQYESIQIVSDGSNWHII